MSCIKYNSCKNVPCGSAMNKCKPEYCFSKKNDGLSRNWNSCNLKNLGMSKYKKTCKSERKCKLSKSKKITKHTVDVSLLHKKMPYIWRFLKPNTRKHMIELATKPESEININFMLWDKKKDKTRRALRTKYKNI